jgi:hypothetical protein
VTERRQKTTTTPPDLNAASVHPMVRLASKSSKLTPPEVMDETSRITFSRTTRPIGKTTAQRETHNHFVLMLNP